MRLLPLGILLTLAAPVLAQAPVITAAGDPSVRNDTIYHLAVNPADYPDQPYVYLLDDGVLRYEADGTGTYTYRQVIQILRPDAVESWAEQSFSYQPGHEELTVNWVRVLDTTGAVVSETPAQVQDADVPAALANPVYTDRKVRRYSLSGVAPGTLVDYSYTVRELTPFRPGDGYHTWSVTTGRPTLRSRYLLDLPAGVKPLLLERNSRTLRHETVRHGRHLFEWAAQNLPKLEGEPFAADSNGITQSVEWALPSSWQAIGQWYAGLARGRDSVPPDLEAKLHDLVAGAPTLLDSLRAVHRWVAQDVRYVSIALGIGGYQPRGAGQVLATGYGDCKDKATLFIALAHRLGVPAWPVLLNAGGAVTRQLPSIAQFDHAIAAVDLPTGRTYVDLTSDLTPFGDLPPADQGEFALVVHPDGRTEEVTLPETAPAENLSETVITGAMGSDGRVTAHYEERAAGNQQYALRSLFTSPVDSVQRSRFARAIATEVFAGASGDSLEIFDGRDLGAEPRVALRIVDGQAARLSGGTAILTIPFGHMGKLADAATDLEHRGPRQFPIDAGEVVGPTAGVHELLLTLPPGWRAHLPANVDARSEYGSYHAEFSQTGRQLKIVRRIEGTRGVLAPDRVGDLISWFRSVSKDDADFVVIETR